MKNVQNKTMGLTVTVSVPSSIEEYDQLAGRKDAALEDAIQYNLFHSYNSDFRGEFVKAVEKETGIKRNLNEAAMEKAAPRKDGTKPEIFEQEGKYFQRVLAETDKDISEFQDIADEVASRLKFDLSEGNRGGGKIGKEYITAAESIISADKVDIAVGKLEAQNPGLTVTREDDGTVTAENLARAIKVNADRKRREELAELTA